MLAAESDLAWLELAAEHSPKYVTCAQTNLRPKSQMFKKPDSGPTMPAGAVLDAWLGSHFLKCSSRSRIQLAQGTIFSSVALREDIFQTFHAQSASSAECCKVDKIDRRHHTPDLRRIQANNNNSQQQHGCSKRRKAKKIHFVWLG